MIDGLRALSLSTPRLAEAVQWWGRALDAAPMTRSDQSAEFVVGGTRLTLRAAPGHLPAPGTPDIGANGVPSGGIATMFWGVDHLEAELNRLLSLGATVAEAPSRTDEVTRIVVLSDPFGARFGLIERDDPAERHARSQRAAERVALRKVRGELDQLAAGDAQARRERRLAGWVMTAGAVMAVLVVVFVISTRQPAPQSLELRPPSAPVSR